MRRVPGRSGIGRACTVSSLRRHCVVRPFRTAYPSAAPGCTRPLLLLELADLAAGSSPLAQPLSRGDWSRCRYHTICKLNHSCEPNCAVRFLDGTARASLVALRSIAEEEELTISYVDTELPQAERAAALANYLFACTCGKCTRERGDRATWPQPAARVSQAGGVLSRCHMIFLCAL